MKKTSKYVVKRLLSPIEGFLQTESSSGILLMVITFVALTWANSPFYHSYLEFTELPISLGVGQFNISKTLHHWVNDGLMVVFFFVVGLEIKRELIQGELSSPKKAALPLFAALGGMVIPAVIYTFFNHDGVGASGWGIPMATDIAFAVGVLALFSRKVPFSLKIFLLALAIVDDLGAVLVIAFFYTDEIVAGSLGLATLTFALTYILRMAGVRNLIVYIILGIVAWFAVLKSGVHSTVAGVILGLMTPVDALYNRESIATMMQSALDDLLKDLLDPLHSEEANPSLLSSSAKERVYKLNKFTRESISPLDRLIHTLHPWVSFFIMPIFALVNAGVRVEGITFGALFANSISLGVIFGLFIGKPVGVALFSYLAIKLNFARLPRGVTWNHIIAVGFLAGIGFTMALFIGHLALVAGPELETYSKLGILTASVLSAIVGSTMLYFNKSAN